MENKMKSLVYIKLNEQKIQYKDYPEGNFIIKVLGCGVCGTDLKAFTIGHHMFTPPTVLGHEILGEVVETYEGSEFKIGDNVVVAPYFECSECELCENGKGQLCKNKQTLRSGGFSEFISIPQEYIEKGVYKVKDSNPIYTLVEPLACVLNGSEKLNIKQNSKVLIIGGGPMGSLFGLLFKTLGIECVISEPNEERRNIIDSWGLSTTNSESIVYSEYDNVVIAVNNVEVIQDSVRMIRDGGTVLLFSGLKKEIMLSIDAFSIHYREVSVVGSFGYNLSHFKKAIELVEQDKENFRKLISGVFEFEQADKVFSDLQNGKIMKAILKP